MNVNAVALRLAKARHIARLRRQREITVMACGAVLLNGIEDIGAGQTRRGALAEISWPMHFGQSCWASRLTLRESRSDHSRGPHILALRFILRRRCDDERDDGL